MHQSWSNATITTTAIKVEHNQQGSGNWEVKKAIQGQGQPGSAREPRLVFQGWGQTLSSRVPGKGKLGIRAFTSGPFGFLFKPGFSGLTLEPDPRD